MDPNFFLWRIQKVSKILTGFTDYIFPWLKEFEYIKTVIFSETTILEEAVEDWPVCDCLIAFHSVGFPLGKAIEYAKLRKPFIINNLEADNFILLCFLLFHNIFRF